MAHGGTTGAMVEFAILFVPLMVVFYLARKKSRDDATEEGDEEQPDRTRGRPER